MENVNSAVLTCRAETEPVTEAQPGAGEGAAPSPRGTGTRPRWPRRDQGGGTPAGMLPGDRGRVLFGSRRGPSGRTQEERGGGSVLALAEGGEGAWLPKPDGLDAELLNYEY